MICHIVEVSYFMSKIINLKYQIKEDLDFIMGAEQKNKDELSIDIWRYYDSECKIKHCCNITIKQLLELEIMNLIIKYSITQICTIVLDSVHN